MKSVRYPRGKLMDQYVAVGEIVTLSEVDGTGVDNDFEDDEALGDGNAATHSFDTYDELRQVAPPAIELLGIYYRFNAANAVTFQLHLLEATSAVALNEERSAVWSGGVGETRATVYQVLPARPPVALMATEGRMWYKIDWSGVPGNTPGYIYLKARVVDYG